MFILLFDYESVLLTNFNNNYNLFISLGTHIKGIFSTVKALDIVITVNISYYYLDRISFY